MNENRSRKYLWSLRSLRTFEVCARKLSFSNAAVELNITQGAVSKQIKTLEQNLDIALFERYGSKILLTSEGKELALHLTTMFEGLDDYLASLGSKALKTPLVISCEPTICLKFLIPLVPQIEAETGVPLRILSAGGTVDFHHFGIDLAIRRNDFAIDKDLDCIVIGEEMMGPVIRCGIPFCKDADPASYTRLHASTRQGAWSQWASANNANYQSNNLFINDIEYQHHFLALEATQSGQGIAMMSIYMVARNLETSKLEAPKGFTKDGSDYVCLSRKSIKSDPRKQAVVTWLQKKFAYYAETFA